MPIGYEFGFKRKLDVVSTGSADWETGSFDITGLVRQVNNLKMQNPLLQDEGELNTLKSDRDTLVLERRSQQAPGHRGWILINKNKHGHTAVTFEGIALTCRHRLHRTCRGDESPPDLPVSGQTLMLDPAEVILLLES